MSILDIFNHLTAPQAEVIASATTLFSAAVVAIVAPLTFHLLTRRGVKGFNDAVEDLKTAADRARDQTQTIGGAIHTIGSVATHVTELGVLLSSVQEALANTQNTLLEGRTDEAATGNGDRSPTAPRERVRVTWRTLQEAVEQAASDPLINGNTRARYARMDRRAYLRLIDTLLDEGRLTGASAAWHEAYAIAAAARNAAEVTEEQARRIADLASALRQPPAPDGQAAGEAGPSPLPPTLPMPTRVAPDDSLRRTLRSAVPKRPPPDFEPPSPQQ